MQVVEPAGHLPGPPQHLFQGQLLLRLAQQVVEGAWAKLEENAEAVGLDAAAEEADDVVMPCVGEYLHLRVELLHRAVVHGAEQPLHGHAAAAPLRCEDLAVRAGAEPLTEAYLRGVDRPRGAHAAEQAAVGGGERAANVGH